MKVNIQKIGNCIDTPESWTIVIDDGKNGWNRVVKCNSESDAEYVVKALKGYYRKRKKT
jgi:hypothetical protein